MTPLRAGRSSARTASAAIAAVATGLLLAGCAGPGVVETATSQGAGAVRAPGGKTLSAPAALDRITLGRSTRDDVAATLGPAIVLPFDSGYEVWLYRWPGVDPTPRSATELVVLFAPSGLATKARLRPGYPPRP